MTLAKWVGGVGRVVPVLGHLLLVCACTAQLLSPAALPRVPAMPAASSTPVPFTPTPSPVPSSTPATASSLWGTALVQALLQGGHVIYFRHAATDPAQTDAEPLNLKSCRRQRNLDDRGRADARAIGLAFLALDIPIGQVLSSEYCRTRDTAMLAFGQAESTASLTGFPEALSEQRIAALREMLSTHPESGTNTVLVAHGFNITNTAGIALAEGEAAIFTPSGADGFTLVARVLPGEWVELERMVVGSTQAAACEFDTAPSRDDTQPGGQPGSTDCAPDPRLLADPELLLPDLQSLPPSNLRIRINAATGQKLLRFTNSIANNGPGAVEIWGDSNSAVAKTIVVQHIYKVDDSVKKVVVGEFIFHPEHDHWHLGDFARYELWSVLADGTLDSIVTVSDKVSYCLRDDARTGLSVPHTTRRQNYTSCNQKKQGISAGWIDVYKYYLPGQYLDVTGLPDGAYALRTIANPDNRLWERDRTDNAVVIYIEIKGNVVTVLEDTEALFKLLTSEK